MLTSDFDYDLPDELIAQFPCEPRDAARLMVLRKGIEGCDHRRFVDLPTLLEPGDMLVRNDTRVVPARLVGVRESTGGRWEGLFLREGTGGTWRVLARTRGKPVEGETVTVGQGLRLRLEARTEGGIWVVRPEPAGSAWTLLEAHGQMPLPPYIRKGQAGEADRVRYQTLYAKSPGAVAAPTAGLHFTEAVLERLAIRGVGIVDVTLHVGLGTFRPIDVEHIEEHSLHAEWAQLSAAAAQRLNACRADSKRIVAVGTTTARVLETAAATGRFEPFCGETSLYLRPGHTFRGLDALLTNFHLPRSSLLVLVSAFAGKEAAREAYAEAVAARYRFYSYGDAMLVL